MAEETNHLVKYAEFQVSMYKVKMYKTYSPYFDYLEGKYGSICPTVTDGKITKSDAKLLELCVKLNDLFLGENVNNG